LARPDCGERLLLWRRVAHIGRGHGAEIRPPYDMCEMGVGALSAPCGTVAPVSSPASATSTRSVRLRLNPTNAQAAVSLRAAGACRFAFNWDLAQIKGEPGPVGRGGHLRHPQDGPDSAVLVLRPGSTLGRGQVRGRAVACRAVGLDVPVRHPRRTHGTLPFREGPVPVPQVQGPPPGPAPVHDRRRSAPSAWSPAGRQVRVGRPRRARAGRRSSSGGCWCAAGPGY